MNNRLTLQDLAGILSEKTGKTKIDCERFLRAFVSLVTDGLVSDKTVKIKGLGAFKLVLVEARGSVDVSTGERIVLPAHYKCTFLPDTEMKDQVNEPFSFFETIELSDDVDMKELDLTEEASIAEDIEEEEESPADEKSITEQPTSRRIGFLGFIGILLAIVCGLFIYLYLGSYFVVEDTDVTTINMEEPVSPPQEEKTSVIPKISPANSSTSKVESTAPFQEIKIVHTRANDRLTYMAEEYYGNKVFWVYIYQFNKTVIRNPDVITVGLELILPEPSHFGIDANDTTSIRKALDLADEIKRNNK